MRKRRCRNGRVKSSYEREEKKTPGLVQRNRKYNIAEFTKEGTESSVSLASV